MRKSQKLLALILTVLTVISVFSVATPVVAADLQSVNAEEIVPADEDKITEDVVLDTAQSSESDNEPTILGEDESRRTADTKHFIMSDGTRKAVIYGNNVHYEEDGKWLDIDNTLTYDKEKKEFKNKSNSFKATFKEDFSEENLFTLEKEGYTISWEYYGGALRKALTKTEYKEKEKSQNKITKYAEKTEDRIKYKNFESHCELEYVVTDNGVKENIILNSKTNKNEFTFKINAKGLTLTKNEDGSITVKNVEGREIFFIPAPFMYDSNDIYSYYVSYELEEKNGIYTITVVADKNWLKDDNRVYPVIIDPVVLTKRTSATVNSTFVTSAVPTANYGSRQDIYIGHESANYGTCYAMFKNSLPALNKGDMVVGASLNLYLYGTSFDGGSNKRQLDAHIITSSWAENSVTWNTKPTYNSVITDYMFLENGYNNWLSIDITKAVKGWYEGSYVNHGILIKENDESPTPARGIFRSENATSITDDIPHIEIAYRNNKGLEGYWSYTSFSNGVGGTASVNDYSGNLVYTIPIASSVSEIMPVSLSLVYNNYSAGEIYTAGKSNSNLTSAGKGWKLNYQQTLLPSSNYGLTGEDATNYPYVYTDGDGTEHYIAKFTENGKTVYKDEDGLGYTFTNPGTSIAEYKLSQDDGSFMYFNSSGNLTHIYDNSGNRILITYDSTGKKLTKITDGTGHTFTISYISGTNYISTIEDNAGRKVNLTVSGGLTQISMIDGSQVYLRYHDTTENLLYYAWSSDGIGRTFLYTSKNTGRRVFRTMDFSATDVNLTNYVLGQVTTFDRSRYNTTTIRTPGIDGVNGDINGSYKNDDIVTTLQFDNFGRTLSQQVSYGNDEAVGAGTYTYTGDDEEESRNRIARSATLNKNTVNLLTNGNAESTTGWTTNSVLGGVTHTYGATTNVAYVGKYSLKLTNTSVTSDGYSYAAQTVTGLKEKCNYTYSAYVKTENISLFDYNEYKGAYLMMVARGADGSYKLIQRSTQITTNTDIAINNGWRRISMTMNIPEDTSYVVMYIILCNATGTAYFDGLQLEEGTTPNSLNLLQNASFEKYTSTGITDWTATGFTYAAGTNGVTTTAHKDGSTAIRLAGSGTGTKGFYQLVPVASNPDDTYIVSGWGAAYAVNKSFHKNLKFEIAVQVTYSCSDNTTVWQDKDSAVFNTTVADWQYASSAFSLAYKKEPGDTKTYTPTHILVTPRYNYQANYAYFDHIQLIKDVASSYIYDSEGNVTSVSANAQQKNNMTYEGKDLKTYKDAAGQTTSYTYYSNHRLTEVKSPKGVKTTYNRISTGQVNIVEVTGKTDESDTIALKANINCGYTPADTTEGITYGAYLSTSTDEHGYTTKYDYDMATGALKRTTAPDYRYTKNEYDNEYTKLLSVTAGYDTDPKTENVGDSDISKVSYSYNGNRVSQILFSGIADNKKETYSFGYDSFGNVKTTSVGQGANAKVLVTNTYNPNNGLLHTSNYANGDAVRYTYAKSGLVAAIYHDNNQESDSPAFTWEYSSNGTPRNHIDNENGNKYNYSYDSIGRLIRTDISNGTGSSYIGSTEYGYDIRNNLTSITNDFGGAAYTQLYSYGPTSAPNSAENAKDNLPTSYIFLGQRVDYAYDDLNRLTGRTLHFTNTTTQQSYTIPTTYTYNAALYRSGCTTNQLATETLAGTEYSYSYDVPGNIKTIFKNGNAYREYEYDKLNQLTQEKLNGSTVNEWTYDGIGNITLKTTTAGSTKTGIRYNYGADSNCGWENLLTSVQYLEYNGSNEAVTKTETIDYDAIGNPITYRGASLSWYGRQLKSFAKNGITSTMTYDADDLRTSKTLNGSKTEYQYVGDKLFYENRGNNQEFYYFYDSYGKLSAIRYNYGSSSAIYYAQTNALGDVIGLYNSSNQLVASYEYDAWGNTLSVTDNNGNPITAWYHIGFANPIRYRGYYYDIDLGLYYLQSRYYDAEIGRWINPEPNVYVGAFDSGSGLIGYNVYAYCANNPINFSDPTGKFILTALIVGVVAGAVIGGAIGGTVAYNSAKSSGLEGSDLFFATAGGVGKGALIGGVAGGLVGATGGVVAAYGATSVAGTAMITATATITAKATEVTALQAKKSTNDGDNGWQIANDCIDSVFSNGGKFISPALTKVGTTSATYVATDLIKHKVVPLGFNTFLHSTGGKVLPYGFALLAWGYTGYAIFCSDPIAVANQRGYRLR